MRCQSAARDIVALRGTDVGWAEVNAAFNKHGVGYEKYRTGARLVDLDSPETARIKDFDRKLSPRAR